MYEEAKVSIWEKIYHLFAGYDYNLDTPNMCALLNPYDSELREMQRREKARLQGDKNYV